MQKFKKKYDQYASKYLQTAMNKPKIQDDKQPYSFEEEGTPE
jgi:hypothetical protein